MTSPTLAPLSEAAFFARLAALVARNARSVGRAVAKQAVWASLLTFVLDGAMAQTLPAEVKLGLTGSIGMGVASMPTYEGSPNRRTFAVPWVTLNHRSRDWGEVSVGQGGFVWQAIETGDLRLGLVANPDAGRKDRKLSGVNPTPGDKRLAGMGEVRASTEAGVLVGYGPISVQARKSLGDRGHKGTQVDLGVAWPLKVSDKVGVTLGAGLTWADKDYMQAYFGVTPAQSQASGFRAYTPKAGVRKFDLSMSTEYAVTKDWKLQGSLQLIQLTGDAARSPVVERKSNPSLAVGVAHVF